MPIQFLHLISLFLPRSENFEKAFIQSINIPAPRSVTSETEAVSMKILKTLTIYKDFSPQIAVELLLDKLLSTQIRAIEDPVEVRKVIEDKLSKDLEKERS